MIDQLIGTIALVVYGTGIGALARRRHAGPRPRSLGAAARKPNGPPWATVILAIVVIIAATVLIITGGEIPPAFTVILATVGGWIGANAPGSRK